SRDCARKICSLDRQCDVMASADFTVVQSLLMPDHANFNIRFATNEMAIAYTAKSKRADEINAKNWHEILLDKDVIYGRADPNRDPCGYRSVMVMQLAENHYKVPGLAGKLESKHGQKYIRPKETDLLALLEAGEIDYLFIYRSVAEQHGIKMLLLPDEVNLGKAELAEMYAKASVEITGKKPGEPITKKGKAMVYSVTIPLNTPNRKAAEAYVLLLLSEQGREIMRRNGQPPLTPAPADGSDNIPDSIRKLTTPLQESESKAP
ncbi:MAG TPA: tungstate ABC transporter substrate-binding protein WtpA, partial [Phycisphaerae bacterium]|nr:tungstate ABC transporter substrate-binding protein WtpA [Phycisphaerae bacterium]